MTQRFSNSWAILKASAGVLRDDKELLVFPLLSGVSALLVSLTFLAPFAFVSDGFGALTALADDPGYAAYAIAFLYYFVLYTVVFFFNAALVGSAMIRMDGGDPTVGAGLSIAVGKFPAIVGYAAIAATVGMVLRAIEERVGALGRIVIGLLGLSWTLTTYLTVPVLVTKEVGAIDAVKESAGVFRRTWGEQVIANAGIGFASFVVLVLLTLTFVPLLVLASKIDAALVLPLILPFAGGVVFLSLVASALKGIYSAALYRYATSGDAGEHFDGDVLARAFRQKKKGW